jgi:hypothetical protein
MTPDIERQSHHVNLVLNFLAPVIAVLALFGLVAQRVDTNQALAHTAHIEAVKACAAVDASNRVTVSFLRKTLVPPVGQPEHDKAKAFVDGLAAKYTTANTKCLAAIR